MIPPHQTPSADLLERIRRYIAAHLQGSSDIIEEARRKLPRPVPRPFEGASVTALRAIPVYMKSHSYAASLFPVRALVWTGSSRV